MMDKRRALFVFILLLGVICLVAGIIGYVSTSNWWFIALIIIGAIFLVLVIWMFISENIKTR